MERGKARTLFRPSVLFYGVVPWMFVTTGPFMLILDAASGANVPENIIVSWLMFGPLVGGIITIILNVRYRAPVFSAMTMHGSLVVIAAFAQFSFPEIVGAYLMTGAIVCLLALTGLANRIVDYLPLPVVLGMVTGVLFPFSIRGIMAVSEIPLLTGTAVIVFLLTARWKHHLAGIPPTFWAVSVGIGLAALTGQADWSRFDFRIGTPVFTVPALSLRAFFELTLPLVIMVTGVHGTQAAGIVRGAGYDYPTKGYTLATGLGTLLAGWFGTTPLAIMGPATAMLVSGVEKGEDEHRWTAGVLLGILIIGVGLLAPVLAGIRSWLPAPLVSTIAGLAVLSVLSSYLGRAFSGRFRTGAMFAFIVTASGISFFGIGSPLWGVLSGLIVSVIVEPDDFRVFWDGVNSTSRHREVADSQMG